MKRSGCLFVAVILFLVCTINAPFDSRGGTLSEQSEYESVSALEKNGSNILSNDHQLSGTLNPVVIEQRGNRTNPVLHAETDSKTNVKTNLSIDIANNWVGSRASVELWNLERLYVVNGSFSEGLEGTNSNPSGSVPFHPFGWDAISGSPDPNMEMTADYVLQEVYVGIIGERDGTIHKYTNGSYAYWIQTVNNTPYLEDFILNFDYSYERGPVDNPNVTLRVYIDDNLVWTTTSVGLIDNEWYNTGDVAINLNGIGGQFNFKIGLYIDGNTTHDKRDIQFIVDNVKFVGETPPSFDEAVMTLNISLDSAVITGTSFGVANITNDPPWQTENVLVEISSELGYSFDYRAILLSHRYINSSRTTTLLEDGVHFTSLRNENPLLEFYTFVGVLPDLDDFTLIISTPTDWENATVYNAYGTPVTASCIVKQGSITIPNSLLSTLGWWEVHMYSPNYLHTLQTLKLNELSSTWVPDSVFRTANITKPMVTIGDESPTSSTLENVNITWLTPDGEPWFSELMSGGSSGIINGSQLEFGPLNATAGSWSVYVTWTNGTELAYGSISFEVHHGTALLPHEETIETESGLIISNFVYFRDSENNEFITDPTASVTANWSASIIAFVPDPIQNRWVGTFDTSLVGPGTHLVVVNASRPFFDDISCTFNVTINFADNELTIDNPSGTIGIDDTYLATFTYSDAIGVGIPGANVSIDFTGPAGGITWSKPNDLGSGDYSMEFTAVHSGQYVITITANKSNYEPSGDALFIIVRERTTFLNLENGSSAIISYGGQYRLVVQYTNGTGHGLDGANVIVHSTNPETEIGYTNSTNEGNGYYSFTLTPQDIGTWTIVIKASLQDYQDNVTSFTLTATAIATQLRIVGTSSPSSVGVEHSFDLLVFYETFESSPANISMADIRLNFTSFGRLDYSTSRISLGSDGYLITINASRIGSYEFTIYMNKTGYQSDFESFTLFVVARGMKVIMDAPVWTRLSPLDISLQLQESDTNDSITGAIVTFWLMKSGGIVMEGNLTESSPGVYTVSFLPQWIEDAGYSIRILAEKDNFGLDDVYQYQVLQYTPPEILWQIMVAVYGPPIVVVAVVGVVSLSGRVVYKRRKRKEFATFIENQRRFNDTDNIIGVIVMHKKSGIPIYSRIVKGGFEEGIVAAFISAVTTFRDEFEMLDEESMRVIPISDIIRAVQTPNLICAFITVRSASMEHNRKIEAFSKETSKYLDDFYMESKPPSTLDPRIAEIINYLFDETMDGVLLKYHKLGGKRIPKRYEPIEQVLNDEEYHHCARPVNLARALSKYGVPEARGCTLVSEAIEKELIVLCDEEEFPESDFDLQSFLNKSAKSEE
ncbi:MAG: collagen binding domain-containing protein [Candidatus Thorarchaeota archaeon]